MNASNWFGYVSSLPLAPSASLICSPVLRKKKRAITEGTLAVDFYQGLTFPFPRQMPVRSEVTSRYDRAVFLSLVIFFLAFIYIQCHRENGSHVCPPHPQKAHPLQTPWDATPACMSVLYIYALPNGQKQRKRICPFVPIVAFVSPSQPPTCLSPGTLCNVQ